MASSKLIGTAPDQAPSNADLGSLAFQDSNAVKITGGDVTANHYVDTAISEVKPSLLLDFANGKTLDPRITFTRSTTATYYDGKTTAMAEQNVLPYSQDVSYWTVGASGEKIIANVSVAPDGTNTAALFREGTANGAQQTYRYTSFLVSGLTYTWSGYLKAAGRTKCQIIPQAGGTVGSINIDLTAVTASVVTGYGTASIVSVGNGWYRFAATFVSSGSTGYWQLNLMDGTGNTTYTGDGVSGVYIWGAQIEQRSGASAYVPTYANAPVTNYIPAIQTAGGGAPRFDHDPITGESKGLLIEEQRTNIATYSQDFTNAAWTKLNAAINANATIAPDGTLTASRIYSTSTNGTIIGVFSNSASGVHTVSMHVKAGELSWVGLRIDNVANDTVSFNIKNGTVGAVAVNVTAYSITSVGNGWYRISVSANIPDVGQRGIQLSLYSGDSQLSLTADINKGIYIWGAQEEAGAFPTSYIPTTSAQVTRSADGAVMTSAGWSSYSEGTFAADATINVPSTATGQYNVLHFGTNNADGYGVFRESGTRMMWAHLRTNNSSLANLNGNVWQAGVKSRVALSFKNADSALAFDGGIATTTAATGAISPSKLDLLYLGASGPGWSVFNGTISRVTFYPKRLSNAELQEMTQ